MLCHLAFFLIKSLDRGGGGGCDLFLSFTCLHNASCMLTCNTEFISFMRTPHGSRLAESCV